MQGIGLGFTDGNASQLCQPSVYGCYTSPAISYPLMEGIPYSKIYAKVAFSGDETVITGIRIGETNSVTVHHEWRKIGTWQ